jgi:hypothetical protein
VQSVVHKSLGRCTTGACGRMTVWQVVVGWTRLQRDGVGSRAACHKLVCDTGKCRSTVLFLTNYSAIFCVTLLSKCAT